MHYQSIHFLHRSEDCSREGGGETCEGIPRLVDSSIGKEGKFNYYLGALLIAHHFPIRLSLRRNQPHPMAAAASEGRSRLAAICAHAHERFLSCRRVLPGSSLNPHR